MARMSDKDKKIIESNPNVAPHDLLTMHGLSENGFNMLVAAQESKKQAEASAIKPKQLTPSTQHILQPIEIANVPVYAGSPNEKVRLVPKSGGIGTLVNRSHAERMIKKYPNLYNKL